MPRIERSADVVWEGDVSHGAGRISGRSGAFDELPYSLATRVGTSDGKTSPEELLAAAHAGCYAMSLAGELAGAGTPAERLQVTSKVVMDEVGGSHRIVRSELHARARVKGSGDAAFADAVRAADDGCPFSALIKASGTVTINAELEGGTDGD
jgi:lipoyl-dependent peroxiredoxin